MKNKKYTEDNFELESVLTSADGHWLNSDPYFYGISPEGKFDINYSNILTILIQEAGRICKHFASDLFITWSGIDQHLSDVCFEGGKFLFGFREMGVDHNVYVLSRLNNYGKEQMEKEIQELYMLEVSTEESYGSFSGILERIDITMKFGKAKIVERKQEV